MGLVRIKIANTRTFPHRSRQLHDLQTEKKPNGNLMDMKNLPFKLIPPLTSESHNLPGSISDLQVQLADTDLEHPEALHS